jgi:2-polyprenyl-3-methyl-5-hydroxy-6-metoxy-1,4-benzoquinol methylase
MKPVGGMNPDNFAALYDSERGNFWFEPRNRLIVGLLNKYFPTAQTFMEVGCGTGFVLSAIAASRKWDRLYGSELYEEGLTFARKRLNGSAELIQMDARSIPEQYRHMDVIGAFDVIEHIEDDEAVLSGIHQALEPKGGLMIAVPQHRWLWSSIDEISHHVRRYSADDLHDKIKRAGFRILFSGSYTFALLPAMMLSRIAKRADDTIKPTAEFSATRSVNALLRAISNAEVALTLAGARFPIGGSRVVVAQKI